MNAKRKGAKDEHRSITVLESAGYAFTRAAESLGIFDVIGMGPTDVVLVQCKTRDWPGSVETETIRNFQCPAIVQEDHSSLARPCTVPRYPHDLNQEVIMSQIPINRRNAGKGKTRTFDRGIQKAPPTLRTVNTVEQFDQLDQTMARQGRGKLPRLQTGRFPD